MPVKPVIDGVTSGGDKNVAGCGARSADTDSRALHARQHVDPDVAEAARWARMP